MVFGFFDCVEGFAKAKGIMTGFGTRIGIIGEIFEIVIPLKLLRRHCPLEVPIAIGIRGVNTLN